MRDPKNTLCPADQLWNRIESRFEPEAVFLLRSLSQGLGQGRTFLVGGFIRDIALGVESVDIDIMTEFDSIAFATHLWKNWEALFPGFICPSKPRTFRKYGTAKLLFPEPVGKVINQLDFSTARSESYPVPGHAPVIHSGSVDEDLLRRDFGINALALEIVAGATLPALVDIVNGYADLQNLELNVLHDQSFVDDPARLLRGLRAIARYGFTWGEKTAGLFDQALAGLCLLTLPGFRLLDEFRKGLEDFRPNVSASASFLLQLEGSGLLPQVSTALVLPGYFPHRKESSEPLNPQFSAWLGLSWQQKLVSLYPPDSAAGLARDLIRFECPLAFGVELTEIWRAHHSA